jgi:iron(III) transport system substrate-binding protein
MSKTIGLLLTALAFLGILSCREEENNRVVIFSSSEDFRNDYIQDRLNGQFPGYDITIEYFPTGNNAAKLKAEGLQTECDIVYGLETGYLEGLVDNLADLSAYDASVFLADLIPAHHTYLPWERFSGCVILNNDFLDSRNLPVPGSYEDLVKPEYQGAISMPNPKSSGTGFMFLRNLINTMGEDAAFMYFDRLSENILQFTTSGSGPVNALILGEAGIGLGMTFQAVNAINNGASLEIRYFREGAPFTITGLGIIKGRESRKQVKEVFDFLVSTVNYEDKERFSPEQIFANQSVSIQNYPPDILYADMTRGTDLAEKERLLDKWKY